jgi:hypothetical protein
VDADPHGRVAGGGRPVDARASATAGVVTARYRAISC